MELLGLPEDVPGDVVDIAGHVDDLDGEAAGLPGDRVDNRGLPSRAGPAGGSRIRLHLHGRIRHHRSSPVVLFAAVGRGIHEDTDWDDARKTRLNGDRMKGRADAAISGEIAERDPADATARKK